MTSRLSIDMDKRILGEAYSTSEPMDNLSVLCDEYGSRFPGTKEDKDSVAYLSEKLNNYGLDTDVETYNISGWVRKKAILRVKEPVDIEFEVMSLLYSLPDEIEAKLVYLGDGHPEIFKKKKPDIEGNIVLVTDRKPFGVKRSIHRTEKFLWSVLSGARGFIYMNHCPGVGPKMGAVSPIIPAITLSYEQGSCLIRLLRRNGNLRLSIKTRDIIKKHESYNIITKISGTKNESESTLVGVHYEGYDVTQGAIGSASGVCVAMEMANILNTIKDKIKRNIIFVLFGASLLGQYGSRSYVNRHLDELTNMRLMLNLAGAGNEGRKGLVLMDQPKLEPLFNKFARDMNAQMPIFQNVTIYSDFWPFFVKGVPSSDCGDLEYGGESNFVNTLNDTADKVKLKDMQEAIANYSRFLLRVANIDEWPAKKRNEEEIEDAMKTWGVFDTIKLPDIVKDYVEKRGELHIYTKKWLKWQNVW